MKTIVNLAKVVSRAAVLSMAIGLSVSAQAQSTRLAGEQISDPSQGLSLSTELDARVSVQQSMDAANAKAAAMTSTSLLIAQEFPKAVDKALGSLSIEKIKAGATKTTVVIGGTNSLIDEQAINVKVDFDQRPVGGILTVRASMTPSFRGVGVSTRPVISRSIAMAVDELDQALVDGIVRELTAEINQEFAHK